MTWVFGENEFKELLEVQNYYLIQFTHDAPISLFGHFAEFDHAWRIYSKQYLPVGYDVDEFRVKIQQISETLNSPFKYKYVYALRDNDVFMGNEFRRLCYLNRDVYRNGTFHYPCTFWYDDIEPKVRAHPGNHLLYALLMYKRDVRCLFTIRKSETETFFTNNKFAKIHKKLLTLHDMQRVLGRPYTAWLQQDRLWNPAVVVADSDPKWQQLDTSGFLKWPGLDFVQEWAESQWWYDWFPKVCEGEAPISQHIEVRRGFATKEEMFGNLLGFLLNADDTPEDKNFAVLNYAGKQKSPMRLGYIGGEPAEVTEISYFGNRWNEVEPSIPQHT